ncbi:MAG: hypothetical protein COT53_08415 [Zetaproteobacteria bacterium CG08_land_8_20_14_0_20_55_17]|nr:MAG: hypothetical protein COT53_08415 [Zetaproteobacteria bacterium CG08_land_8_20_14_0_20_55_17]PIY53444.1 MAG: hypothetical protein COZ01_03670 [Zetaproteobacteria bacterium CG_4_10_14_0_8_um_filter_55_43]
MIARIRKSIFLYPGISKRGTNMNRLKQNLLFGAALLALLSIAPFSAQAAAILTSTYMAAGGSAAVTVTNNGPDAVANVNLQPSGAGVDAQAPVNLGTIAAGGKAFFKLDGVSPSGYIFLDGNGSDAAGQPVSISIVSKGN